MKQHTRHADVQLSPIRVLIVEDSEDILFIMKTELDWLGFATETAKDGLTAIELARRTHPDVILSDIQMPGIDGFELIRRVRQIPGLSSVPAIALTGFGMEKDVTQALARGFNAHMTKPVEPQELSATIQKLAQKRHRKKAS